MPPGGAPDLSPTEATTRTWLMRPPRPALLHIYARDGREYDVEIKQGASWAETAKSVTALEPERLEAYSPDKKLLRAVAVGDLVQHEAKANTQAAATSQAMMAADPETQRMIVFAELLERAHGKAIEAIERTVAVGFQQMQEISASLAQQATAATQSANDLSVAIRNLLIQQAQDAVEHAQQQELSPLEQMAANFVSGQQLAQAQGGSGGGAPVTNGKRPNGKH